MVREPYFVVTSCGAIQFAGDVAMTRHMGAAKPGHWHVQMIVGDMLPFLPESVSFAMMEGCSAIVDDFGTLVPVGVH